MSKLFFAFAVFGLFVSVAGMQTAKLKSIPNQSAASAKGSGYGCGCFYGDCNGDDGCSVWTSYCYYHHYPLLYCCSYWWSGTYTCSNNSIQNWKCWDKDCYATF